MMGTDTKKSTRPRSSNRRLTVVHADTDGGACTTCRSNEWIWEEEIELVRGMNGIKNQVREARQRGDQDAVLALREEFVRLRTKMEKVRRQRLDSLGHYNYD